MGWFGNSKWDPGNWDDIRDVPILGDIHTGIWGDPEAAKNAYDQQIAASKDNQLQMQQFLMGKKGEAQQIYGPMQHMFQASYGTEGLKPQENTRGPLSQMYGSK